MKIGMVVSIVTALGLSFTVAQAACNCDCVYMDAIKRAKDIPSEPERQKMVEWYFNSYSGIIDAPGVSSYGKQCGISYKTYMSRKEDFQNQ